MKKVLLIICFALSYNYIFCQTVSNLDCFKGLVLNFSELQVYMINKGFEFNGVAKNEFSVKYSWSKSRSQFDPSKASSHFSLFIRHNGSKMVTFTSGKNDYLQFKQAIKTKGFKYSGSETEKDALIENYSGAKYSICIWIYLQGNNTIYEMSITTK